MAGYVTADVSGFRRKAPWELFLQAAGCLHGLELATKISDSLASQLSVAVYLHKDSFVCAL
jgi:hypothetical protein